MMKHIAIIIRNHWNEKCPDELDALYMHQNQAGEPSVMKFSITAGQEI